MKKIIIFISVAIFAIGIFIFFLPSLLSSNYGKKYVIAQLEKKTGQKVSIENLQLSWLGPQNISHLQIQTPQYLLTVENLHFSSPLWHFLQGNIKTLQTKAHIQGGKLELLAPQTGLFEFSGSIDALENATYALDIEGIVTQEDLKGILSVEMTIKNPKTYTLNILAKNFPTEFVEIVFAKRIKEILGPIADISVKANFKNNQGPFECNITSSKALLDMHCEIQEQSIVLKRSLKASFFLTPQLIQLLSKTSNVPNNITSETPIHLWIDQKDFILPKNNPKELQAQGILDLGKMYMENQQTFFSVFNILKLQLTSSSNTTEAWFSPVNFFIDKQMIQLGRMDALIDHKIHICTWGKLNLKDDSIHMTLGITADALRQAFGITTLSDNYVMKVPIRGTFNNVKIDTSAAAAKIAALIASSSQKGIGGIFGFLMQSLDKQEDVPPPKRPFPWE